jgi:hypothetical protein
MMLAPGARMGYFVNPDFLRDPELRQSLFDTDWPMDGRRPLRLLFAGNPEPQVRRKIVEELTQHLAGQSQWPMLRSFEDGRYCRTSNGHDKQAIVWMVRGKPDDPNWESRADSIHPKNWAGVLKSADFSVCPPGYELKTHRVIESLLCGSIPILDCPQEYDVGLMHGVNCLVARKNTWKEVVSQALNFSQEQIIAMRENIRECRGRFLSLNSAGTSLAQKCGLKAVGEKI